MPVTYRMKPGMGSHTTRNKRVLRPGDTVVCEPEDLGGALSKFEAIAGAPTPPPPPPTPRVGLVAVQREDGAWDVVNGRTGRPINDAPMSEEEALKLATERSGARWEPPSGAGQAAEEATEKDAGA